MTIDNGAPFAAVHPVNGRRIAQEIQQRHPRWRVWYSLRRGDFWALVPESTVPLRRRLIRAFDPAELVRLMDALECAYLMAAPAEQTVQGGAGLATPRLATLAVLPPLALVTADRDGSASPSLEGHFLPLPPAS